MTEPAATTPFTIITGFLGAGKTSLVNRLLSTDHGRRFAIMVNEFGEINIDGQLLAKRLDGGVVELTNGCVCCAVSEDLRTGLRGLLDARRKGATEFDHIILETTGLAKAGPIIQTLSSKALKEHVRVSGVVTVVDAFNVETQLAAFEEAAEQVGMADLLLLNKTDLVDSAIVSRLAAQLSAMNGLAAIRFCQHADIGVTEVLSSSMARRATADFSVFETATDHDNRHVPFSPHSHSRDVRTFAIQISEPLDHGRLLDWFSYIVMRYSERLLRYKGILNIENLNSRVILQGVHSLIEVNTDRQWLDGEVRQTAVVFIGQNLPEQEIRDGLANCVTGEQPIAK